MLIPPTNDDGKRFLWGPRLKRLVPQAGRSGQYTNGILLKNRRHCHCRPNKQHLHNTCHRNNHNILCEHQQWYLRKYTKLPLSPRSIHHQVLQPQRVIHHAEQPPSRLALLAEPAGAIQMVHCSNGWNGYHRTNKQHLYNTCDINDNNVLCKH